MPSEALEALHQRRDALIRQKFGEQGLSPAENSELALLDWKIDQIEYRAHKPTLDRLSSVVAEYEEFGAYMRELIALLKQPRQESRD